MAALSATSCLLGQSERNYILAGCRQDCRLDGRTCHELRPYVMVRYNGDDPLMLSHGSARLLSANACSNGESTQLLASVKAELVPPPVQHLPNHGAEVLNLDTQAAG